MRKLLHTLAEHAETVAVIVLLLGVAALAAATGCAGLGEDLTASLEEGAIAGTAAAAEGAGAAALTELEGGDADWETVGIGAAAAAALAFGGALLRRRLKRRAAEVNEG